MRIGVIAYPMLFQRDSALRTEVRALLAAFEALPANTLYGKVEVRLVDVLRENLDDHDLIHVIGAGHGNHTAVAMARACGVPVLLSPLLDGSWRRGDGLRARACARLLGWGGHAQRSSYAQHCQALLQANLVVARSRAEWRMLREVFLVAPAKLRLVPPGVAAHYFDAEAALCRQRTGLPDQFALMVAPAAAATAPPAAVLDVAEHAAQRAARHVAQHAVRHVAQHAVRHVAQHAAQITAQSAAQHAALAQAPGPAYLDGDWLRAAGQVAGALEAMALPLVIIGGSGANLPAVLRASHWVRLLGPLDDQPRLRASVFAAASVLIMAPPPRRRARNEGAAAAATAATTVAAATADADGAVADALVALAAGTAVLADPRSAEALPDGDYAVKRVPWDASRHRQSTLIDLLDAPPVRERVRALVRPHGWEHIAARLSHCYADAIALQGPASNVFVGAAGRRVLARNSR